MPFKAFAMADKLKTIESTSANSHHSLEEPTAWLNFPMQNEKLNSSNPDTIRMNQ